VKTTVLAFVSALFGIAFVGQGATNPALKAHVSALQGAKSLTASFTVARLPGAPEACTLAYSKPDKFRIETPSHVVVSDGKTLWDLDKTANTYTEGPASTLRTKSEDAFAWAAFFDADSFKEAKTVAMGAKRTIKGNAVQEIVVTLLNGKVITLFADLKSGAARGASVKVQASGEAVEYLAIAQELTIGTEALPDSSFTFAPPAGAVKQVAPKVESVPFSKVQAVFSQNCVGCHGSSGGLSLESYAAVMRGARGMSVVVPGDAANSGLIRALQGRGAARMPKNAPPLNPTTIKLVADWIDSGAKP
jgi:outer membrane lipoprotein-sorting protein